MTVGDYSKPTPPPFPVGTRLRYLGRDEVGTVVDGVTVPTKVPGLVVTITRVFAGRQGTGHQVRDEDGPMFDDDGEPICHTTQHGYSVYDILHEGRKVAGRCIFAECAAEWEVLP